jgi:uncharacterized protein YbjT (DUF2867 family)
MSILILGANGFIGSAVAARLCAAGHAVTGLGRDIEHARRRMPGVTWIRADLADLDRPALWAPLLDGIDVVVNCAGALQDGPRDDLAATQRDAMLALYRAAGPAGIRCVVQISARTQGEEDLAFLATKADADTALTQSGMPHVILRPTLVLGRNAHGGSALLRALAATPFVLPLVYADRMVETVALADVAEAVLKSVEGAIPAGSDIALAGDRVTLGELVRLHRAWLGLSPAPVVSLPGVVASATSRLADLAGRLGWRSPLRGTAMAVMSGGIGSQGAAPPLPLATTAENLAAHPAGVQDLWFARLYLLKPVFVLGLAIFWLASGLVPFLDLDRAAAHFLPYLPRSQALAVTAGTSLLDIALGLAVLWRSFARRALQGQIALALCYLAGGTLIEPALWADPLGPYVKVLPAILLAAATLAILDER